MKNALRLLLFVCLLSLMPGVVRAQPMAAGGEQGLWLVTPGARPNTTLVLHRLTGDPAGQFRRPPTTPALTGVVAPPGAAAGGGVLWIAFRGGTVQSIHPTQAPELGRMIYETRVRPSLPAGELRGWAANRTGVFALLRDGAAAEGDNESSEDQTGGQADEPAADEGEADTADQGDADQRAADAATEAEAAGAGRDRLYQFDRGVWRQLPLPEGWPEGERAVAMLAESGDASWPVLLTADEAGRLRAYVGKTVAGEPELGWEAVDYPVSADAVDAAAMVQGQLVVARQLAVTADQAQADAAEGGAELPVVTEQPTEDQAADDAQAEAEPEAGAGEQAGTGEVFAPLRVSLSLLRRGQVVELGELEIDRPGGEAWALASAGQWAAVVSFTESGPARWARIDLQGQTESAEDLEPMRQPVTGMADYVVLVVVLLGATLVMFAFWRRDPAGLAVELPDDWRPGGLVARVLAAVVDLAPAVGLALVIFDIDLADLQERWPGSSGGWVRMAPGLVVIGVYIAHTTVTELFTGRTLGKKLLGLRVLGVKGDRPSLWQILGRNLLKIFELIAQPLLIMVLLSPHRQRLGDMVAGTVVATPHSPEDEPDDQDQEPLS